MTEQIEFRVHEVFRTPSCICGPAWTRPDRKGQQEWYCPNCANTFGPIDTVIAAVITGRVSFADLPSAVRAAITETDIA